MILFALILAVYLNNCFTNCASTTSALQSSNVWLQYNNDVVIQLSADSEFLFSQDCPSHNGLSLPGTRLSSLCYDDEAIRVAFSLSSQQQRRWTIVCGSPQSQLTDCVLSSPHRCLCTANPSAQTVQQSHGCLYPAGSDSDASNPNLRVAGASGC